MQSAHHLRLRRADGIRIETASQVEGQVSLRFAVQIGEHQSIAATVCYIALAGAIHMPRTRCVGMTERLVRETQGGCRDRIRRKQ